MVRGQFLLDRSGSTQKPVLDHYFGSTHAKITELVKEGQLKSMPWGRELIWEKI
jgi:hypothetical protein